MSGCQTDLTKNAAMLFFHGNAMESSPFFQALDDNRFQISNKKLGHNSDSLISMLSLVNSFLNFGRQR